MAKELSQQQPDSLMETPTEKRGSTERTLEQLERRRQMASGTRNDPHYQQHHRR
jgi:hypothetical protein